MKVFILEDNVTLSKNLEKYLNLQWIKTQADFDWPRWLEKIMWEHFDVIILDINLPWISWIEICKQIRDKWITTPILMLTSRTSKDDVVKWFQCWADDYLWKPFEYEILFARIEAMYRRDMKNKNTVINLWDVTIDLSKRKVLKNWDELEMSTLEFNLLKFLLQNRGVPVDRKDILERVWWEFDTYMFSRNVDVYIWYLRKKIWFDKIKTVKWFWYVID